ncbi:MAG TPA: pitrilysin family protein [Chitinophagales bacterium]|nr:pitrilysin family protein [Chitinophagales bacterium]
MVSFEKFTFPNGLRVIAHTDKSTPMAVLNILYNVGARDEQEDKTGFAHLFEHLMFGGSENAPSFDEPLQRAGGESNAFTNNDITNYYDLLPAENIETAFWLESDRMRALNINAASLDVQRKVVCEEFKEHYLNQPYGDVWHKLSSLAYKVHPYKWPTIGKDLSHIENAQLDDVRNFFQRFYTPSNAIMVIAGNIESAEAKALAEKWFGKIEGNGVSERNYPKEPQQTQERLLEIKANVPVNALFKAWHIGKRDSRNFYVMDIVSDLLAEGTSSRLYQNLVKNKKLFSEIDASLSGSLDEGLFLIEGRLYGGVTMQQADAAITEELEQLKSKTVSDYELQKVKNKIESTHTFGEANLLTRAMHLAFFELLGDAGRVNTEISRYMEVSAAEVLKESQKIFVSENCSTIYYYANN